MAKPQSIPIGGRFGHWTVLALGPRRNESRFMICRCDCGTVKEVLAQGLRKGATTNCGCVRRPDFTGRQFGRWLVLRQVPRPSGARNACRRWECRCDCGTVRVVESGSLLSGASQSCGCIGSEITTARNLTHGGSKRPEYVVWCHIIHRCENRLDKQWMDYGGRGITLCRRWRESFAAFFADMGPRPTLKHSIDRIDNDGGYWCGQCMDCILNSREPNCRWATPAVQRRNCRRTHPITFCGRTMVLQDWAGELGVDRRLISDRLKRGWSTERALTEPPRPLRGRRS